MLPRVIRGKFFVNDEMTLDLAFSACQVPPHSANTERERHKAFKSIQIAKGNENETVARMARMDGIRRAKAIPSILI